MRWRLPLLVASALIVVGLAAVFGPHPQRTVTGFIEDFLIDDEGWD